MVLWTVQPKSILDMIIETGVYRCTANSAVTMKDLDCKSAYDWLCAQMRERIGPPPEGTEYPVWAWHTYAWAHEKPDVKKNSCSPKPDEFLLTVDIPDEKVLLTDEELWIFVLNGWYLPEARTEEEADFEELGLISLSAKERSKRIRESWKRIIDPEPFENEYIRSGCFVQATFWELRKEQIIEIEKGRRRF